MNTKIFVLDTNVVLHDFNSIHNFDEHDVVIPITVLEELDNFKKGHEQKNYNAREFMRQLDKLAGKELFSEGVSLGKGKGLLFVEPGKVFPQKMTESFKEDTMDHRILSVAYYYNDSQPNRKTILVTQDINFRMKAKSLGIDAQDYNSGKVKDLGHIKKVTDVIENVPDELIGNMYKNGVTSSESLQKEYKFTPNKYVILKGNKSTALAHFSKERSEFDLVVKRKYYGIEARNAEQAFALDMLTRPDIPLVSITGAAGTGKTLLALAAALDQRKAYTQIYLARPIVPLANRDMGFLPGDEKSKIGPYMQPLFDNLSVIKQQFPQTSKDYQRIESMLEKDKLLITPLAYIRGRSLPNVFFIVDEAQNLTPHEVKTIITRAGEGTKMVFTGDINQIDSPYLDMKSNGLSYLADRMKGQELFAHINLMKSERSSLAEIAGRLL